MQERERPKIAPKPIIATKPKYVPPVKIQQIKPPLQKQPSGNVHTRNSEDDPPPEYVDKEQILRRKLNQSRDEVRKPVTSFKIDDNQWRHKDVYFLPQSDKEPLYPRREDLLLQKEAFSSRKLYNEECRTETSNLSSFVVGDSKLYKKTLEVTQKPPNSPSTVCCSILSNAATDCCGIINVAKNELNGKMTKLDSLDSSSDSGGFKDFVPPGYEDPSYLHHQRKKSQPEFFSDRNKLTEVGHQRKTSLGHSNFDGGMKKQPNYVANAQALAQFLPQTEQKILLHNQKADEARTRQPKPILSHGSFQQSTKKLEELLAQRLEREKNAKKGGANCLVDPEEAEQKMRIQRQIQQKLHADLEQTVKQIQEIQSTEYRLPQNRKWTSEVSYIGRTPLFLFANICYKLGHNFCD